MEPDQNEKSEVNLDDILLPKKEGRTSASAERVNAGVLLVGEQNAVFVRQTPPVPTTPPPAPKPVDPKTEPISPLQTYKSDVATVIQQKNISVVSMAAAEAERLGQNRGMLETIQTTDWNKVKNTALLMCGVVLIVVAVGGLSYAILRPAPSLPQQISAKTPFITVDDTQVLLVSKAQWDRTTVMQNLNEIKNKTDISLGLISRNYVAQASSTADKNTIPPAVTIQALLGLIAPNAPDTLLRSFEPNQYLLGVHMFDGTQPLLIVKVDSYEQAFSGMLEWERTMQQELAPYFTRTPHQRLNSTTQAQQAALLPGAFRDKVVANHDARVILNDTGDILLLWTFLDRNTLVITTADTTLGEIISRRSTPLPGQ